jgi:3-deoxy-D-manno-octulosonic-acid transferase
VNPGELVYRSVARLAPAALRLAAPFHEKARRGVAGRQATIPSMAAWAAEHRVDDRPLIWLHAPSVGEALMAQAILAALREQQPGTQAAFTYFSPSAERVAGRVGADWSGYLPWDVDSAATAALDALRPSALAFVRTEIWPVLGALAARRHVPVFLLNAVLAASSSRTGRGARFLLGPAYRRLDGIGAASDEDAARFALLGVEPARVTVTGDARFDQVWQRVAALEARPLLTRIAATPGPWLVAGSTWPADEAILVAALAALRADGTPWRMIIAPHEPAPAHVSSLEQRLQQSGFTHARLPELDETSLAPVDALVVDRVGVLADLYAVAHAAWVGGGFGRAGLHSVVEPAGLGVPVLFGPRLGNAQEAARLAAVGGGVTVSDAAELAAALRRWARVGGGRSAAGTAAGEAAQRFVRDQLGGAARNARLILR